jgi:hypothetical protein
MVKGFSKIGDVLSLFGDQKLRQNLPPEYSRDKYVSREFQKYGFDLAQSLGDMSHKSLYIKLAKETPRALLESAKSFVMDANSAKNKGSLFMWRLGQLKKELKAKGDKKI